MDSTQDVIAPKVSVLMLTYNHERFIAQAVESVLAQETSFPIEIVVGEDCSTDRTREILLKLQQSHPGTIRLLFREKNLGPQKNYASTFAACTGQYIAMLEGDDYWTNPKKLQKQVDALDAHPEWSVCFHITRRVYDDGSKEPELYPANWTKEVATVHDLFQGNLFNTCSQVFRNRLFGALPSWLLEVEPGDWITNILNADCGPVGCILEVMADYRIHSQGLWSSKGRAYQLREILRALSRLDHHFQGKYREPIDQYRINLVNSLVAEVESLTNHLSSVAATKNNDSQIPDSAPTALMIDNAIPSISIETPDAIVTVFKTRSALAEIGRKMMRPMENSVRRARRFISKSGQHSQPEA